MITFLLVGLATFSTCKRTGPTNRGSEPQGKAASEARGPSDVLILFSGLMVFHERGTGTNKYEVGILQRADHMFSISVDGIEILRDSWPEGRKWSLETPEPASTAFTIGKKAIASRRPDTDDNQNDFGWLIDIETLHSGIKLTPEVLNPIIQLPDGEISTKYKSYDLKYWQGPKSKETEPKEFGFVPETISLELELRQNQPLLLKNDEKTLNLIEKPMHKFHVVVIRNVPKDYSEDTFHHYYEVFKDVDPTLQYHFEANRDKLERRERLHPKNPFPGYKYDLPRNEELLRTCCMMACTAVRTTQPLQ